MNVGLVAVAAIGRHPGGVLAGGETVGGMIEANQPGGTSRRGSTTGSPPRPAGWRSTPLAPGVPAWMAPVARRMRLYDDNQLIQLLATAGFGGATVTRSADGRGQLATARRP
jgi:hypothetical protein